MTQKRGLGRGLGSLIPTAATKPPVETAKTGSSANKAAEAAGAVQSDASKPQPEPKATKDKADSAQVNSKRAEAASGASKSTKRPVDMFFSGAPVESEEPAKKAGLAQGLTAGLADSAKARKNPSKRKKSTVDGSSGASENMKVDAGNNSKLAEEVVVKDDQPVSEPPASDAVADETADLVAKGVDLVPVPGAVFAELPIEDIKENPRNPRTVFDDDALDELAYSLREVGVLQPIVVRKLDDKTYELVMGERRWRAAQRAGLTAIPAIIRNTTDDDLLRDALLENLHRADLNPLEEANAYQQLLDDFSCTQEELSVRIGRSRPQISNSLRLLRLPPLVQRRLASGAISAGHARALLGVNDSALIEELCQRIINEGLSVRAVERLVGQGSLLDSHRSVVAKPRNSYNPQVVNYTSRLSRQLEAPVKIDVGKRKGKITLEFTTLEDLERLMNKLGLE